MKKLTACKLMVVLVAGILFFGKNATAEEVSPPPSLAIPKFSAPPTMDGKIDPEEWKGAAVISGFMGATGDIGGRLAPQESRIFLAHDGKRLFIAVFCELPEGVTPSRKYRRRDEPVYLDTYQLEVWLTPPHEGQLVTHQFIGNAYGAIYDNRQIPSLGVVDASWNGAWEFQNSFERGRFWVAELAIDLSEFSNQPITADQVWQGLVAVAWPQRSWPYTFGFYKAVDTHAQFHFAGSGDAAQVLDLSSLLENRVELDVRAFNASDVSRSFTARLQAGNVEIEDKIEVPPHSSAPFKLSAALPEFPAGTRSQKATLNVRGPDGEELLNGDWFYSPAVAVAEAPPVSKESNEPFDLRVQFAPISMGIRAWADVLDYPKRKQIQTVRFSVVATESKKAVVESVVQDFAYDSAESYLWLPKDLPLGEYTVQVDFLDAQGAILDARSHKINHTDLAEKFVWMGNEAGKKIKVNPPFEPVKADGDLLRVWGRTYQMTGAFPSQITSRGLHLLARPIALVAERDGEKTVAKMVKPFEITEATPEKIVFTGSYELGGLAITLQGRLEFDGMLYYDMEAKPLEGAAAGEFDRIYLSMPVESDRAMYYFSTGGGWNPAYGLTMPTGPDGLIWDNRSHGAFVPYVGLADDSVALQWFADNEHDWVRGDDYPMAEILREEGAVEVRINLVRQAGAVPAFAANFGFIPSPVRPMLPGWRNAILDSAPMAESRVNFFFGPGHGATPIDLHDTARLAKAIGVEVGDRNPDVVLRDLSPTDVLALPKQQLISAISEQNRAGLNSIYGKGTEDPKQTIPSYFYNAKMYFEGNRSEAFRILHPGEWTVEPPSWFHLTTTESYSDFFAFYLDLWFKHWFVPGLYFDEVYLAPDFNVFNGNGKRLPDGSILPSFALMHQRAYLQRMRQLYFDNERTPFIWVHTTDYMAPHAISATDIAMFGENASPTPTADMIDTINPLLFRSIAAGDKFGFVPIWMNMSGRGGSPWLFTGRQTLGWCWLHDAVAEVHTTMRGRNLVAMRAKWGIDGDDVEFSPYWSQSPAVTSSDPDFLISAWTRPGGHALILVLNRHRDSAKDKATITLDPEKLEIKGPFVIRDLESGPVATELAATVSEMDRIFAETGSRNPPEIRELAKPWQNLAEQALEDWGQLPVHAAGKNFEVAVPPRDFKLFVVEPEK